MPKYLSFFSSKPGSAGDRRRYWLVLPAAFIFISAVGRILDPNPSGLGTHRALGLPKCLFLEWTGLPCPGCGLTTSFTHLLHGQWREAFAAHALGPLLFAALALAAGLSLFEYFDRKTPLSGLLNGAKMPWAYAALTVFLGTWALRLASIWQHHS